MTRPYPQDPGYVHDSDTSLGAAVSMEPHAASLRIAILNLICKRRNMTCDEVEVALKLRHQTASARIRELVLFGVLIDSGARRKTRSNRMARVYVPKPVARG